MPDKLIRISRKQHDSFNNLAAGIRSAQDQLQVMANTLLQGCDEELGEVPVKGVHCADGIYSLVIEAPPIAPAPVAAPVVEAPSA